MGGGRVRRGRRDPAGQPLPGEQTKPPPHVPSAAFPLRSAARGQGLGRSAGEGWRWPVRSPRPARAFPALPPPPGPLPPSQPADEVMPEPSGGGGLGPCGRGCVAGRERVAEGREPRQLSPNWGVRVNAPLETRSQKRREFVYRPALQAGGGEEESPVRAEAHLEPPEHLAELSQEPRTSHLWGLRCLHPLTVRGRSGSARRVVGRTPSAPTPPFPLPT